MQNKTVTFLGAGKIACSLIQGILSSKSLLPQEIFITSKSGLSSKEAAEKFGVIDIPNNSDAIQKSSVIILCTKPGEALTTLQRDQDLLINKLVVSVAAGIRSEDLFQAASERARILRAMPNTAVRVGKGTIAFSRHASATSEDFFAVKKLFSACAAIEEIPEEKMDAVTALSGSGPAFALLFLEGLMEAGMKAGLDSQLTRSLAAHTLEGAAALVLGTTNSLQELRSEITSPNGTTAAGLNALEKADFKNIIAQAVEAARHRAQEMAQSK